uniref:Uncharacterized protein n=1 Tax=Marseillevirus LCMAC202 TaxID=2506606 RepID=A0A481YYX2_9VIRU|nr:MAG: hypothetical protein LCMAC202_04830 [Marseillevirus LCMAC202]
MKSRVRLQKIEYLTIDQPIIMFATSQRHRATTLSELVYDQKAQDLANAYGLKIQNVSWEDTARSKDSCWGPNISDMTLTVESQGQMPAIRKPNFSDVSYDVNPDDYAVTVGNESGNPLRRIKLTEYLRNFTDYNSGVELKLPLYTERDSEMLASSQACVLPLKDGEVEFNIRLYNYQSYDDDSSVLVIVASSQGTSAQIIKGSTKKLYFRLQDQKANFLAKRLADDRAQRGTSRTGAMTSEEQERNVLFIYQIPLKLQKEHTNSGQEGMLLECCAMDDCVMQNSQSARGMDNAVLRAGEGFGVWPKITQTLERDTRWPIRLTLQYYKVTDEITVNEADFQEIAEQINKIYNHASATGSLVLSSSKRPTEPQLGPEHVGYLPPKVSIGYVAPEIQIANPMFPPTFVQKADIVLHDGHLNANNKIIVGNRNTIHGNNNTVYGDGNRLTGNDCISYGSYNSIQGQNSSTRERCSDEPTADERAAMKQAFPAMSWS